MTSDLIFLATSWTDENSNPLDKYLNGYATIQFSPRGGVEVGYDNDWFCCIGGPWFWPAHPGERIRFRAAPGCVSWPHRHVGFRGPLIEKWRREGLWLERPQRAPSNRPSAQWDEYFHQWIEYSRRSDRRGSRLAQNRLEELLLLLADAREVENAGSSREPWLEEITAQLADVALGRSTPIDYAALAAQFGMSEATLRRRFKRALSISPHAYLIQLRVAAARAKLTETDLPQKAIAAALGYENEYYFSRQFREVVGVAPGVYRRSRMRKPD